MYAEISSGALMGIDACVTKAEADVSFGFPAFSIVGLPDTAIRESRERIRTAIVNSDLKFPDRRVTVNLSPADFHKEGTHFDLPIAVAVLAASENIKKDACRDTAMLGELALDGTLKPVKGVLPMISGLIEAGIKKLIIPSQNAAEAAMSAAGIEIYAAESLLDVYKYLTAGCKLKQLRHKPFDVDSVAYPYDFAEVRGHETAKRAVEIACAAMHNLLLVGAPGCGKTMIAKRIPSVLPPMSFDEMLEVTKIYSAFGMLDDKMPLVSMRPFRTPDHTTSPTALIGGGRRVKAGEVTLAHMGVLFLDELPEFSRAAIESLRRPMEDGEVTVSRLSGAITLPSRFLTVAAMNPCPCGYYGDSRHTCTCTLTQIQRYRSKISGPFIDRIDLLVNIAAPDFKEISSYSEGTSSAQMREHILKAREIQKKRFANENISYNSQMTSEHARKYCELDANAAELLDQAFHAMNLSIRAYERIIKVSRTIADMKGNDKITTADAAEAISYKCSNDFFR